MASSTETGHAKNLANFKELITILKSFGTQYNPMLDTLQISSLETVAQKVEAVFDKLKEAETMAKQATATLQAEFKTLNTLTSQLMGLLISSGAKESSINEARSIQKRITGGNIKTKKVDATSETPTEVKATRSNARLSYDSRLDDFAKFVMVLQNVAEYKPNEVAFKPATLQEKIQVMKKAIEDNDNGDIKRSQFANERNTLLYTEDTGITSLAQKAKEYVKAVFGGVKSTQYKALTKIKITLNTKV